MHLGKETMQGQIISPTVQQRPPRREREERRGVCPARGGGGGALLEVQQVAAARHHRRAPALGLGVCVYGWACVCVVKCETTTNERKGLFLSLVAFHPI